MKRILYLFSGFCRVCYPLSLKQEVLNVLLGKDITVWGFREEAGRGSFYIPSGERELFSRIEGCLLQPNEGFPHVLDFFKRRSGLFFGGLLGLFLLLLASVTVWRVEISGNETLSAYEVTEALASAGISVGDLIPSLDIGSAKIKLLKQNKEISFASISVRGTTVKLQVLEKEAEKAEEERGSAYANLIASCDAVVEEATATSGRVMVKPGTAVKKGELLISGVYQTATGVRLVKAEGQVMGRTGKTITVQKSRILREKVYERQKIKSFSLFFFGKTIKLFDFTGNSAYEYDIIKRNEQIVLGNEVRLPISFQLEYRIPYRTEERILTDKELEAAAAAELKREMALALRGSEPLARRTEGRFTEQGYQLTCQLEYLTDIAASYPFTEE